MKLKVQGSSLNWQVGNVYAKAAAKVSLKQPCGGQLSAQVCARGRRLQKVLVMGPVGLSFPFPGVLGMTSMWFEYEASPSNPRPKKLMC